MDPGSSVHIRYHDKPFARYHRVVADLVLRYTQSGGRVLDLGCGLGHVLDLVHRANPQLELTGADPDPTCLSALADRVPSAKTIEISQRALLGASEPALLGSGYQTCLMCHSLEHTWAPAESVQRVLSLLDAGGHLILAVPNPVRPQIFFGNLRRRHYVNRGHAYAWDRSHWMNFLENILDLDVVTYAEDEVRIFSARFSRRFAALANFEIALARWAPWWSFSNIAVVRASGPQPAEAG
jgi:SAM-dependent methyltransferase